MAKAQLVRSYVPINEKTIHEEKFFLKVGKKAKQISKELFDKLSFGLTFKRKKDTKDDSGHKRIVTEVTIDFKGKF